MMIAYCGLTCTQCPAYLATQSDDDAMRQKTAEEWSKMFGAEIKPEAIVCDGCLTENGRLFFHCNNCEIRACGMEKDIANCAPCDDYPCNKLDFIHQSVPEARQTLDRIRDKMGK